MNWDGFSLIVVIKSPERGGGAASGDIFSPKTRLFPLKARNEVAALPPAAIFHEKYDYFSDFHDFCENKKDAGRPYEYFPGGIAARSLFWDPMVKNTLTKKTHNFLGNDQFRRHLEAEGRPMEGILHISFIHTHT